MATTSGDPGDIGAAPGGAANARTALAEATRRLTAAADALDAAALREPSALPDWTRAHVLSHVARNADALVNLLGWTRGDRTPLYPSAAARAADIEAGAHRDRSEILGDLHASADRFVAALDAVPDGTWDTEVVWPSGKQRTAADVPWARLLEVELHHTDLAVGYAPARWPAPFAGRLLRQARAEFLPRDDVPAFTVHAADDEGGDDGGDAGAPTRTPDVPVVSGPAAALAGWLTGRSPGDELTVDPPGVLPVLPAFL